MDSTSGTIISKIQALMDHLIAINRMRLLQGLRCRRFGFLVTIGIWCRCLSHVSRWRIDMLRL
ncbi:hypothetical protein X738_23435 [Mesorhizobium sp. LNHC209A00]|nr:hypothetical protein X738_23435 [Mesorhizobium sp. LNHC209A00]ESY95499.1 hypothetical protein X741_08475 [Mesorhizobium sp. LNHC229A00]